MESWKQGVEPISRQDDFHILVVRGRWGVEHSPISNLHAFSSNEPDLHSITNTEVNPPYAKKKKN
jgi:predicted KAP-like P-loop ATPase